MKTKILEALKTEYKTLGLGEKAFDGVAAFLEKTITKEEDIVTAVKEAHVSTMLKGFQADTDGIRTARLKAERDFEEYKKQHPEQNPPVVPPAETEQDKLLKQMQEQINALTAKNAETEKKVKDAALISAVRDAMKKDNRTSDALLDIVFNGASVGESDTLDTLKEKFSSDYDAKYKALYGNGAVPPAGGETKPEGYKPGMYSGVVAKLQDKGYLPEDTK